MAKLLEFKVSDTLKLPKNKIKALALETATEEAMMRNWAPGFKVREIGKPVTGKNKAVIYTFEVIGTELPFDDEDYGTITTPPTKGSKSGLAASSRD